MEWRIGLNRSQLEPFPQHLLESKMLQPAASITIFRLRQLRAKLRGTEWSSGCPLCQICHTMREIVYIHIYVYKFIHVYWNTPELRSCKHYRALIVPLLSVSFTDKHWGPKTRFQTHDGQLKTCFQARERIKKVFNPFAAAFQNESRLLPSTNF